MTVLCVFIFGHSDYTTCGACVTDNCHYGPASCVLGSACPGNMCQHQCRAQRLLVFCHLNTLCSSALRLIQWQKMMSLSAVKAERAFLFLKILSAPSSADSRRKESDAAEGWETPLFDTTSAQRFLSLPFAAEPDDYQGGFIHGASTLN